MKKSNFKYFYVLMMLMTVLINGCSIYKPKYPAFVEKCDEKNDPNCYKIYADLHLCKNQEKPYELTNTGNTLYIGDIFDIKHAVDPVECKNRLKALSQEVGDNYIRGNHELREIDGPYHKIINGILFTHGHYKISYPQFVLDEWEKDGCKSSKKNCKYKLAKFKLKFDRFKLAAKYALENNCNTIVFGHTHKKREELISIESQKIRVINVPKGISYLSIPLPN